MSSSPATERRQFTRHPLVTSVEFYHAPSKREFPGRTVDISRGGMRMYVPATAPVHPGQCVRLQAGTLGETEAGDFGEGKLDATIVRVDRRDLLDHGHIAVALKFHTVAAKR
ncbi:MAG: PilZ domain-containing protein [Planctomycetota bacterium]